MCLCAYVHGLRSLSQEEKITECLDGFFSGPDVLDTVLNNFRSSLKTLKIFLIVKMMILHFTQDNGSQQRNNCFLIDIFFLMTLERSAVKRIEFNQTVDKIFIKENVIRSWVRP